MEATKLQFAIICEPHDRQLGFEVIVGFPDRGTAEHFASHLRGSNRHWNYYVVRARDPIPVEIQRQVRY